MNPNIKNRSNPNWIRIYKTGGALERALASGASRSLLSQEPFYMDDAISDIKFNRKVITKEKQYDYYLELWDEPFNAPYLFCISSAPNDLRAQMVAMRLFLRATDHLDTRRNGLPKWHSVYGGLGKDELRDNKRDLTIPFLVLSNVVSNSTNYKIEKVRDILQKYDNIPRVVVTTDEPPADFVSEKLKMSCNYVMYLKAKGLKIKPKVKVNSKVTSF